MRINKYTTVVWPYNGGLLASFMLTYVFCNVLPTAGTGTKSYRGRWSFGKGRATGCTTVSFSNASHRGRRLTYPAMPAKMVGCSIGFLRRAQRMDRHKQHSSFYIFFLIAKTFWLYFFRFSNKNSIYVRLTLNFMILYLIENKVNWQYYIYVLSWFYFLNF